MENNKHEKEYDINKPQYKQDMKREERNSRKIGRKFKDSTGFSNACQEALS